MNSQEGHHQYEGRHLLLPHCFPNRDNNFGVFSLFCIIFIEDNYLFVDMFLVMSVNNSVIFFPSSSAESGGGGGTKKKKKKQKTPSHF